MFPHPTQHFLLVYLGISCPGGYGVATPMMMLTCISLKMANVEHIFLSLLTVCISSLKNSLLKVCADFTVVLLVFSH